MNRLPYDSCRCEGAGCNESKDCLRYISLFDMGPRTPIAENLCLDKYRSMKIQVEASNASA